MSPVVRPPLRCLFVTYAIDAWPFGPTMIGVLKRFLRLVREMPAGAVEPLWLHAGPLPVQDPLVRELLPRIGRYDWRGTRLSSAPGPLWQVRGRWRGRGGALAAVPALAVRLLAGSLLTARRIRAILRQARPDVVVFGEAPQGGFLRRVADAAWDLRLPQVAVDNFLGRFQAEHLAGSLPRVEGWFLLGVPLADADGLPDRMVSAPPLLAPASPAWIDRTDVTILGYDPRIAGLGLDFLSRLPAGASGRLVSADLSPRERERCETRAGRRLLFSALPGDAEYRALIGAAGVVFCKNGFQQMAESLALGTPVVACRAGGGVAEETLDPALRPFLRFVSGRRDWDSALAAARGWLAGRPEMPWRARMAAVADPARHGAGLLAGLLGRVAEGARP